MASQNSYIGTAGHSGATGLTKEYPVANGVTVTDRDFVYLTGGRVSNASIATKVLLGMVVGQQSNLPSNVTDTGTATGDANGTVKVLVNVEPSAKFVVVNDNIGTTFAASHVGQYMDLIGNTGAQLADTSTVATTTAQLQCIGFGYGGDNTKGVYIIAKHAYKISA